MTPLAAWEALLAGEAEATTPDPLDYADPGQVARAVTIDGEGWIVLIRRRGV
jgi:hypothetical protein